MGDDNAVEDGKQLADANFDENELLGKSSNPEETYIKEIMPSKLALNLTYVESHSLFSDVKIIFRTIKKIFI